MIKQGEVADYIFMDVRLTAKMPKFRPTRISRYTVVLNSSLAYSAFKPPVFSLLPGNTVSPTHNSTVFNDSLFTTTCLVDTDVFPYTVIVFNLLQQTGYNDRESKEPRVML